MSKLCQHLEDVVNKIATSKYNPFYYHGALPQFFLWVLFLSGLLLFAYYMPTVDNAYNSDRLINAYTSVKYITETIPFGALIRGIHRYAGDAMVITIFLHALRVWMTDRYRQYRMIQWSSGIALLVLVLIVGQTGYYLVWDTRSLILCRMTVSAMEAIPFIGEGLKHWFLNGNAITNVTMSNFLFIHIGLSFSLLFGLWIHYVRMQRPVITPPPAINYLLMAAVLLVCAGFPIDMTSPMADMNAQPESFDLDYFFLFPYAMLAVMPPLPFWTVIIGATVLLCYMPWIMNKTKPVESAEVFDNKCTGCSLCAKDCPYAAIEMVPAPAGSRFKLLATVMPFRCSGCGVCVGACAFDAIDLPDLPDTDVTSKIKALAAQASG